MAGDEGDDRDANATDRPFREQLAKAMSPPAMPMPQHMKEADDGEATRG
jgi:hypothetical protein